MARAKHFVQCMHSSLSTADRLKLVFESKTLCELGLASWVIGKARRHINHDTGVTICHQCLRKIPTMSPELKKQRHGMISGFIARDARAPVPLKDYLIRCITLIRQKTHTLGDLCKSFPSCVPTDEVRSVVCKPVPCACAHLAAKNGIPTVDGHCVT